MKCTNCQYDIKTVEQYCPQCGHELYKKKRIFYRSLFILTPIILLIIGGFLMNQSLYQSVHDHDSRMTRDTSKQLLSDFSIKDSTIDIDILIAELNTYINQREILRSIDAGDFNIKALTFDGRDSLVYVSLRKKGGRTVDITANYTLTLEDDVISLDLTPTSIGMNPPLLAPYVLGSSYPIRTLHIPLALEGETIIEEYVLSLLDNHTPSIEQGRNNFSLTYDIDTMSPTNSMTPLDDYVVSETNTTLVDGHKNISFSTADILRYSLTSDQLRNLLSTQGYNISFFADSKGYVYMAYTNGDELTSYLQLQLELRQSSDGQIKGSISHMLLPNNVSSEIAEDTILPLINQYIHDDSFYVLSKYTVDDFTPINANGLYSFNVEQTSWTIMVYMNGSDLESGYDFYTDSVLGSGTDDLQEMMDGLSSDNINLVIETGGTLEWKNPLIDESQNQRWKIENGELHHQMDVGLANMTHPSTLTSFCNWAIANYPSEKYALLLWNHGGGSLYGFGVDEYFYGDSLTLDEMEVSLEDITTVNDMSFDIIGFDACLMATLETAVAVAPYADYLIASEETEPAYGWDYEGIFKELADGDAVSGDRFGELVVEGFMDYSVDANQEELLTLSVIQLNKIPRVVDSMNQLISQIQTDIDNSEGYAPVARAIPQVKAFGGNTEFTGYTDHYDLESFAKKLTEHWPSEANKVITAIDSAVIYKATGYLATEAGGLSFYLPFYDLSVGDMADVYTPVSFSDEYTQFINTFIDYRLKAENDTGSIQYTVDTSLQNYQLLIDNNSIEYVSDVFLGVYYVFDEEGIRIDLGYDAWVASLSSGVYEESFSFWPSINDSPISVQVVYNGDDYIEYETPIYLNGERATLISGWIYDEERYIIFGARPDVDNSEGIVDRNTIEILPGDSIELIYSTYTDVDDNWTNIAADPFIVPSEGLTIVDYEFESDQAYEIAFVIKDYNGNLTYSDRYYFNYE